MTNNEPREIKVIMVPNPNGGPVDHPVAFPEYDINKFNLNFIECKKKLLTGAPDEVKRKRRRRKKKHHAPAPIINQEKVIGMRDTGVHITPKVERYDQLFSDDDDMEVEDLSPGDDHVDIDELDDLDVEILAEMGDDEELEDIREQIIDELEDLEGLDFSSSDDEDERPHKPRRRIPEEDDVEEVDEEELEDDEYAGMTPEEIELKKKQEMLWKWKVLKKQYANETTIDWPTFNIYSDLREMEDSYKAVLKELLLDDAVSNYRLFLVGSFYLIEYGSLIYLKADMTGFAKSQLKMMTRYNRLLIELGAKQEPDIDSQWPVEMRLAGLVLFNAAVFFVGKKVEENGGDMMANYFRAMMGHPTEAAAPAPPPTGRRRRQRTRGPSLSAAEIRAQVE